MGPCCSRISRLGGIIGRDKPQQTRSVVRPKHCFWEVQIARFNRIESMTSRCEIGAAKPTVNVISEPKEPQTICECPMAYPLLVQVRGRPLLNQGFCRH